MVWIVIENLFVWCLRGICRKFFASMLRADVKGDRSERAPNVCNILEFHEGIAQRQH